MPVVLVDDHPIVRDGLAYLLANHDEVGLLGKQVSQPVPHDGMVV